MGLADGARTERDVAASIKRRSAISAAAQVAGSPATECSPSLRWRRTASGPSICSSRRSFSWCVTDPLRRPHRAQRDDEQAQLAGQRAMHGRDARVVRRVHQRAMDVLVGIDDATPEDPLGAAHSGQRVDGVAHLGVELLWALGERDPCGLDLERRTQREQVV